MQLAAEIPAQVLGDRLCLSPRDRSPIGHPRRPRLATYTALRPQAMAPQSDGDRRLAWRPPRPLQPAQWGHSLARTHCVSVRWSRLLQRSPGAPGKLGARRTVWRAYLGHDGYRVISPAAHAELSVAGNSDRDAFLDHMRRHEVGETSYLEMSKGLAENSTRNGPWIHRR
jgi:hypothetical protein